MADIAASVLTRLKNKAQASGRSYQLCLQLFCQEEFLRRLEKSKYAENFVLKGGLFIYSLTEFDSRVTVDVDFLLRQMPNTPEQLRAVLEEIITAPTENEFVTFEITDVAPIPAPLVWYQILAYTLACVRLSNLCIESSHTKFRYLCFCKLALYLSPFCSVNSFIKILSADASCNCDISFCTQLIIELFYNLICIRFRYIQFFCNLIGSDKRFFCHKNTSFIIVLVV